MRKIIVKSAQFLLYKIIFRFMKLLPTQQNKIIYISHYGNRFGCNPKSMFDYIQTNRSDYKHIIVLNNANDQASIHGEGLTFVRYQSLAFLKELATSKYWVVNTNLPPDLKPKKETVYFQTWHGAGAFKKFGLDLPDTRNKEK